MLELASLLVVLAALAPAASAADAPAAKEEKDTAPANPIFQFRDLGEDFKAGRWEACAAKAEAMANADPTNYLPPYYAAACYSHLKDEKRAVVWLERTLEANHPQGGELKRDLELTWIASEEKGKEVFERRKERVDARWEGVLRHQKFGFNLSLWGEATKKASLADYRGKTVAVLLVAKHDLEASIIAATAIQAIQEELSDRGFAAVILHLEAQPRKDVLYYAIERFRSESSWHGTSLVGGKADIFPLVVEKFPAVVFVDKNGVARFIEEGYKDAQATRYRDRANFLVEEAEKVPPAPAGGKPSR